jgi:UPF0176 protein
MSIVNIAAYLFVPLHDLSELRIALTTRCSELGLKGTILLAPEGINLFLAGAETDIDAFLQHLRADQRFANVREKRSLSAVQPFNKLYVKLKKEIVPLGEHNLDPNQFATPRLDPLELKRWLDAGKDLILLDTRNQFEFDQGTFEGAVDLGIKNFRSFPAAIAEKLPEWRERTVVTFCTGGIRCEKAGPLMEKMGFKDVYQLEGGILKYFELLQDGSGNSPHYRGDCFVFDERIGVDGDLKPTQK